MTGCERVLARLKQGPASHHELYQLGVIAHSRIADLRRKGHQIECEKQNGLYVYSLLSEPEPQAEKGSLGAAVMRERKPAPDEAPSGSESGDAHLSAPVDVPAFILGQTSLFEAVA